MPHCKSSLMEYKEGAKKRKYPRGTFSTKKQKTQGKFAKLGAVIGRAVQGEVKSVDTALPTLVFTSNNATAATLLNDAVVGSDFFNRIGRKTIGRSLRIRGSVSNPYAGAIWNPADTLRFAVVYDKAANSGAPTWGNIFSGTDNAGTITSSVYSPININNRDRFIILREWELQVPSFYGTGGGALGSPAMAGSFPTGQELFVDMFVNLKKMETAFSGNGLGAIQSGAIFITLQSLQNLAWVLNGSVRYRFADV